MKRKKEEEKKMSEAKKGRKVQDDWWEESLAYGNQVEWVMKKYGFTQKQAMKKIYSYRYRNGLTDKNYKTKNRNKTSPVCTTTTTNVSKDEPYMVVQAPKSDPSKPVLVPSVWSKETSSPEGIETKIDKLMKLQEEHKRIMDKHYEAYLKEKEVYEDLAKKIDVLCSAMDIMSE